MEQMQNIAELKTRMKNILNDKSKDVSERLAIYQDLLARLRKYMSDIDVPPEIRLADIPYASHLNNEKPHESPIKTMSKNTKQKVFDEPEEENDSDFAEDEEDTDDDNYTDEEETDEDMEDFETPAVTPKQSPTVKKPVEKVSTERRTNVKTRVGRTVVQPRRVAYDSPKTLTSPRVVVKTKKGGISYEVKPSPKVKRQTGKGRMFNISLWKL